MWSYQRPRAALWLVLMVVGGLSFDLSSSVAHAACLAPPPSVLWSYPAQNQRGVPLDAAFWVVANGWGSDFKATLDGRELALEETGTFSTRRILPGTLQPNRDYALVLEFPNPVAAATPHRVEIAFTTGSDHATALPAPIVDTHQIALQDVAAASCPDIVAAQDCFDTGQNANLRFQVQRQEAAIGWLVLNSYTGASNFWPSSCGDPTLRVFASAPARCFSLRALSASGALSEATQYCVPQVEGAAETSTVDEAVSAGDGSGTGAASSDCSARPGRGRASSLWLVLPAAALMCFARRRRLVVAAATSSRSC